MPQRIVPIAFIFGILVSLILVPPAAAQTTPTGAKVGTYDSRCIALAYGRSSAFREKLNELRKEYEEVKGAGDTEKAAELEHAGIALQEQLHLQVFSTGNIDEIFKLIEDTAGDVAKEAGVDLIVNRWDLKYRNPTIETTDVTDLLVRPFQPDDETMQMIHRMKDTPPISPDKAQHTHD